MGTKLKQTKRDIRREKAVERFKSIKINAPPRHQRVLATLVDGNGVVIADRSVMVEEAFKFGTARLGSERNSYDEQAQVLESLYTAGKKEEQYGRKVMEPTLFDTPQARAAIRGNKGFGVDGIPGEVYRLLPFMAVIYYWLQFN